MKRLIFVIAYFVMILAVGNILEEIADPSHDTEIVPDGEPHDVPAVKYVYLIDENGEATYLDESYAHSTPEEPGQVIVTVYEDGSIVETQSNGTSIYK